MAVSISADAFGIVLRSLHSELHHFEAEVDDLQTLVSEGCASDFDVDDLQVMQDATLLTQRLISHVDSLRKTGGVE